MNIGVDLGGGDSFTVHTLWWKNKQSGHKHKVNGARAELVMIAQWLHKDPVATFEYIENIRTGEHFNRHGMNWREDEQDKT